MKISELLSEGRTGSIQPDVADALPATYIIPKLQNQDPYHQYRFGVAIAAAKGNKARAGEASLPYSAASPWGENQVVVDYAGDTSEYIDDALKLIGLSPKDKKLISTPTSKETNDVNKTSPVEKRKKK